MNAPESRLGSRIFSELPPNFCAIFVTLSLHLPYSIALNLSLFFAGDFLMLSTGYFGYYAYPSDIMTRTQLS